MNFTETQKQQIRGITVTRDGERAVSLFLTIDTHGWGSDARAHALSFLYVKALLAGTKKYNREDFLDAISLLGASLSISFANGYINVQLVSTDTNAKKLFSLFEEMMREPAFPTKELSRIKSLLKNELHEEKENAKKRSIELFANALYSPHDRRYTPVSVKIENELETLAKKDVERFHDYVVSGTWVYTLVADTQLALQLEKKLHNLRNTFLSQKDTPSAHSAIPVTKREVVLESIPSKQNIEFSIGNALPFTLMDDEYYAFLFGLQVLGKWGGFAGRLMSTVREKEGLTYGIYARTETVSLQEQGYWRIMTFFAPDKALQGLSSTLREIQLIASKGVTNEEFDRFKTILATGQTLLSDSILRSAGDIHAQQVRGLSLSEIDTHKAKMLSVTQQEVNASLKANLSSQKLVIAGAGPTASIQKELKALALVAKKTK